VIGHVDDLGDRVEGEGLAEPRQAGFEGAAGEVGRDQEGDQVDQQEECRWSGVDECAKWHRDLLGLTESDFVMSAAKHPRGID
jgi:hypothetical protein